ncbi:MAG: hypothetical protein LBH98_05720 [Chitinispirillales bacterium]|jgi:endo-1,4-beta-D-glucanase Y|nr:hypothetical protein [Chitinispirillales bacterium]
MNSKARFAGIVLTVWVLLITPLFAQNRPFPQAADNGFVGTVIKPSNREQNDLNDDVKKLYDSYKSRFLRQSGSRYYILATGNGDDEDKPCKNEQTISEAHGYGMIIFALMAGYDKDAKNIFDGMNELRKAQKATGNSNLMSWVVCNVNANNVQVSSSATDGDLDNAYALLLAYKQWDDNSYLNDAKTLIDAIMSSEMHTSIYRTNLGDWDRNGNRSRSSDWMPGHFRAFYAANQKDFWRQAADTVYALLAQCSNQTTGLIPDFVTGSPAKPDPNAIEENGDKYSYNACRDPWRLALDYAHHGTESAKNQINKISAWLRGSNGAKGDPNNIKAGYNLNGSAFENYEDIIFTAPFASGMIADPANQNFLNSTYNKIRSVNNYNDEYATALQLLSVLLISGNWWAPYSSGGDINPPDPPVTDSRDLVFEEWESGEDDVDELGSAASVDQTKEGEVSFTLFRAKEVGEAYTWAQIATYFETGDFKDATSITVTYTSDKDIVITLIDPDFTGGEGYEYLLKSSSTPKTVSINVANFQQPEWAADDGLDAPLNKNKIEGIGIYAKDDDATTKGKITKFEVFGMNGGSTPISFGKSKGVKNRVVGGAGITVSKNSINLNVPNEKAVSLKISDIRGRLLLNRSVTLNSSGFASFGIPNSISKNQTLILNVKGKNGLNVSQKILLK